MEATILSNIQVTGPGALQPTFRMELAWPAASGVRPGQFVHLQVPGVYLRRPISVAEVSGEDRIVLYYKVVGEGTCLMAGLPEGQSLDVLGPLGNGFPMEEITAAGRPVLLLGGGIGAAPMLETAKVLKKSGADVAAVLGFGTADEIILKDELAALNVPTFIATMDGSEGTKGTVIDAIKENGLAGAEAASPLILACGPTPMLRAVQAEFTEGYVSLEARMACGIGACMGCVVKTTEDERVRVCKDGPVFPLGKVVL